MHKHFYAEATVLLENRDRRGRRIKDKHGPKEDEEGQKDPLDSEEEVNLEDKDEEEDDFSDIFSSDSDTSSLEELRMALLEQEEKELKTGKKQSEMRTAKDDELERMFFYSIYINELPSKQKPSVKPQKSEGVNDGLEYGNLIKEGKDADAARFVIDDFDEETFNEFLKTEINEDEGMEDIDGNVSIRTLCEKNFKKLRMDGPTRRIALLFTYGAEERPISFAFLKFMHLQKEKFPYISGVLLYYKTIGIHVIEASEYILLMHFPLFFNDDCFKKMKLCKVLAIEELSAMKFFEQYSCYKANPLTSKIPVPKSLETYDEGINFMKKIGRCLDPFFKHAYSDFPSVTSDNELPESINKEIPSEEALHFALEGPWVPGLRPVKQWFTHLTIVPGEINDADFVWPPRSDGMPVHFMHPAPDEEETIRDAMIKRMKEKKLQISPQFQPRREEGELPHPPPVSAVKSEEDEFEGVKKIVSKSSLYDVEKLDGDLEDLLEAEELSDD